MFVKFCRKKNTYILKYIHFTEIIIGVCFETLIGTWVLKVKKILIIKKKL